MNEDKNEEIIEDSSPQGQKGANMAETPRTEPEVRLRSMEPAPTGSEKKIIIYAVIALVLIGLGVGGFLLFTKGKNEPEVAPIPTPVAIPTAMPTEAPEPTPAVELERGDLSIQVLNGGGVAGAAGAAEEYLKGLGYVVADTGNAANFDYELTQIMIKPDSSAYKSLLISDLEEKYELASELGEVDEDSKYDVIVIVGKG